MEQPRYWKTLERHPLSCEYEDINGDTWTAFLDGMREHGIINGRNVTLHEGMVLDAWQLQRACVDLNIKPTYAALPNGMSAEQFVHLMNDVRRHETKEAVEKRIAERRQKVAAARAERKSLRAISEEVGVPVRTVRDDLEAASGVRRRTPETAKSLDSGGVESRREEKTQETQVNLAVGNSVAPETNENKERNETATVKGRDGKTYPKHVWPEGLTEAARAAFGKKKINAAAEQIEEFSKFDADMQDQLIQSILDGRQSLANAIETGEVSETTAEELMKAKNGEIETFCRKLMAFVEAEMPQDPWIELHGCGEGAIRKFVDGCSMLRSAKCHAVCPLCNGAGCKDCRLTGRVPKFQFDQLAG